MLSEEVEVCRLRVRLERLRLAVVRGDKEFPMPAREVKNLAQTMRDTIKNLRAQTTGIQADFHNEVKRARVNNSKVVSLTMELKEANQEVEEMLSGAGSNFPSEEELQSAGPPDGSSKPDVNGVIKNNA